MATGGADPITELCEELLSCDVCSEDFDHDARTPRILPCFHSFCESCLKQMTQDGKCQCPKCRSEVQVEARFPMDTTRLTLLDKRRALQSQGGVSCESCTQGAKATSRCQDCQEFLCQDCCAVHRRMKKSKDHTVVSLEEAAKNLDKLVGKDEKCERHPKKILELFCVTCSTAVCITCIQTLHQDGHKFVDVSSMLDEKKTEMLSYCEELEKVEQSFQAKAEESEASVEAVDSHLDQAVHKVEAVFTEIITSATQRQAEIIGELRAKAKGDKLLLGEQSASFRSLQAAAQTAAQYGRRCVALSLVSQVFSQTPELKKTVQDLKEKETTTVVKSATSYCVMTDKLAELQALLKEVGELVSETKLVHLGVTLPSIQLARSGCGSGCCVGADKWSLSNQPCTHSHCQQQSQSFRFAGTCGTKPLPGGSSYWQVRAVITGKPGIKNWQRLCEFGVASHQALQTCPGDDKLISTTDHCAMTMWLYRAGDHVRAVAGYRKRDISYTDLGPLSPHTPVDVTLGLLLDTATSRVHVIDVRATRVLWSIDIDLSTPVWPVVRVWPESGNGARVDVEVQSGQHISLCEDLVRLLQSLV